MATWTFNDWKINPFENFTNSKLASNSLAVNTWDALKLTSWVLSKAWIWDTIEWVSLTTKTFDADNQTVAKELLDYRRATGYDQKQYQVEVVWITITFAWALITWNTIDLKVNWTSLTQVPFNTDNNTTLDNLATALWALSTIIASATRSWTRSVVIVPKAWNASVLITNIVVAWGVSQTTWTVANSVASITDAWSFFDLTATQYVNYFTKSSSTGQLRLERLEDANGIYPSFTIANL